jgi:hypothetical protein
MTIAGDADGIEVGLDTGTADSDRADAARAIVASKTKLIRDGGEQFKLPPEQSDDRTPEEDVEKWFRTLTESSSLIGGLAESFNWQGF